VDGGTTFHLVADGIESASAQHLKRPATAIFAIMGGAATMSQYLAAGLIDEPQRARSRT
jgi:dihydrofolate reductase